MDRAAHDRARLLDAGDAKLAYKTASEHSAVSAEDRIDAEFHAGWIALRFVGDRGSRRAPFRHRLRGRAHADLAGAHALLAGPRRRSARAHRRGHRFYAQAAEHSSAYYGQLARARLGLEEQPVRKARDMAQGDARLESIRAVEVFEAIGERELAFRLTVDLARTLEDETQIAALGHMLARARDARGTLIVGKLASQRGIALDEIAFPTYGVPDFEALARAAEKPVVFAIARQESAFQADVVSHAGAKGLMQMLTSTARVHRQARRRAVRGAPPAHRPGVQRAARRRRICPS